MKVCQQDYYRQQRDKLNPAKYKMLIRQKNNLDSISVSDILKMLKYTLT